MSSKIKSLIWECWKITRWIFIFSCIQSISGRLLHLTGFISLEQSVAGSKHTWFMGFTFLSLFLFIGGSKAQELKLSFPERLFRYPVSTKTLVTAYMVYGIALVALQALVYLGFEMLFFDPVNFRWSYLFIFEITFIILQTIFWFSWIRDTIFHFLLCLLSSGTLCLSLYAFWGNRISFSTVNIILCLTIIMICWAISFKSVSAHRHDKWNFNWKLAERFFSFFHKNPSRPFTSPLQAQIWFELRQMGNLFSFIFLVLIIPIIIFVPAYRSVMPVPYERWQFSPVSNLIEYIFPILILAALITGLFMFALHHREEVSGVSTFRLIRPLSTGKIASARLYATIFSIARVIVVASLLALSLIIYDLIIGELNISALTPVKWALTYNSPVEIITMTILGLYGYLLFCWVMLTIGMGVFITGCLALAVAGVTNFLFGETVSEYVISVMFAAVPALLIFLFYISKRRKLITAKTILITAFIFPLAILSLWAFPWHYSLAGLPKGLPDLTLPQIIYLIIGATIPLIPLAAIPLMIDKLRHR